MATYKVTDPTTGKTIKLTGDSPPTEQELEGIFAELGGTGQIQPTAPEATIPEGPQQQPTWAQGLGTSTGFLAKPAERAVEGVVAPLPERSFSDPQYWTENVPQSVSRLAPAIATGLGSMVYGAAKEFTDPVYNALSGQQPLDQAAIDLFNAPKKAGQGVLNSLGEMIAAPLGLSEKTTAKQAWDDPAASLLALSPLAKPLIAGVKGIAKMPTGESFTKRAIGFTANVEPALQKKVVKTIQQEGALPTVDGYGKFTGRIRELVNEARQVIEPQGDTPIANTPDTWVQPVLEKFRTSAEKSKDLNSAVKYLKEFKADHPTLTLKEANEIRIDFNKKLSSHYKQVAKGESLSETGRIQAMEAISNGLREQIEAKVPEIKGLNGRIHNMIVAKPFLRKAANRTENLPALSTRDFVAGYAGGHMAGPETAPAFAVASRVIRDPRTQAAVGRGIYDFGQFVSGIKGKFAPKEVSSIVDGVEAELRRQGQLPVPPGGNQLALPAPPSVLQMGAPKGEVINLGPKPAPKALSSGRRDGILALPPSERGFTMRNPEEVYSTYSPELAGKINRKALPPGGQFVLKDSPPKPEFVPAEVSALERMFQIAQSPLGKKLLIDRLKREEKYSKLVKRLYKIEAAPTNPRAVNEMLKWENELSSTAQDTSGVWSPE